MTVVVTNHWPLAVALVALLCLVLVAVVLWRVADRAVLEKDAHAETRAELQAAEVRQPTYQIQHVDTLYINTREVFGAGSGFQGGGGEPEVGSPGPGGGSDLGVESQPPSDHDGGRET